MHREGYRDALALHAESQFTDNEDNIDNQSDDTEEECPWAFSEKSKNLPTSTSNTSNNGQYIRVCFSYRDPHLRFKYILTLFLPKGIRGFFLFTIHI